LKRLQTAEQRLQMWWAGVRNVLHCYGYRVSILAQSRRLLGSLVKI